MTTAPTYGLIQDVIEVVEQLPAELFDTHAALRPCGLLDKRNAMGMLIGDVLGLPLLPWWLAETIGSTAVKKRKKISSEKSKARKAAKCAGLVAEGAAEAVLRRPVAIKLPTADAIEAAWRQIRKAAAPPPAANPSAPELSVPELSATAPSAVHARVHIPPALPPSASNSRADRLHCAKILNTYDNSRCDCADMGLPATGDADFVEHSMFCQI